MIEVWLNQNWNQSLFFLSKLYFYLIYLSIENSLQIKRSLNQSNPSDQAIRSTINQSINQPIDQILLIKLFNQSINQPFDQFYWSSYHQSINQPIDQILLIKLCNRCQWISQLVERFISQLFLEIFLILCSHPGRSWRSGSNGKCATAGASPSRSWAASSMTPADFSVSFPPRLDPKSRQQKPKVPLPPCHQTPRRPPPGTSLTFITTSFFSRKFFYRNAQVTARGTIRIDMIHYSELTKSSPPPPLLSSFFVLPPTHRLDSPHHCSRTRPWQKRDSTGTKAEDLRRFFTI